MIQRITNTNMKAVGVEQFIYNQMGGLADLQNRGENEKNIRLDMFADKKKIFQSERIVGKETFVVNLEEIFAHQRSAEDEKMKLVWDFKTLKAKVLGEIRASTNEFTDMPKGRLEVEVVGYSFFHIDPSLESHDKPEEQKEIQNANLAE